MTASRTATTRLSALLLVLLVAVFAAGCGDDDSSSDSKASSSETTTTEAAETTESTTSDDEAGDATVLELGVVEGELKFDKTELTAPAGKITLRLTNDDTIAHNIGVEGEDSDLVSEDTTEVTVDLEPGTYEFYCSPHRSAGMTGTLTVT